MIIVVVVTKRILEAVSRTTVVCVEDPELRIRLCKDQKEFNPCENKGCRELVAGNGGAELGRMCDRVGLIVDGL